MEEGYFKQTSRPGIFCITIRLAPVLTKILPFSGKLLKADKIIFANLGHFSWKSIIFYICQIKANQNNNQKKSLHPGKSKDLVTLVLVFPWWGTRRRGEKSWRYVLLFWKDCDPISETSTLDLSWILFSLWQFCPEWGFLEPQSGRNVWAGLGAVLGQAPAYLLLKSSGTGAQLKNSCKKPLFSLCLVQGWSAFGLKQTDVVF